MTENGTERLIIGWTCEDCEKAIGDEPRMWDLAEQFRKEHENETGHTTTVGVVEEQRIVPSQGDRMEIGESVLDLADGEIDWICPECHRSGEELETTKRCPDCDERLREVLPDGGTVEEDTDQIKASSDTGKYWDCPHCWWEGPEASIDTEEWVMRCPECGDVIDERLQQVLEGDRSVDTVKEWARDDLGRTELTNMVYDLPTVSEILVDGEDEEWRPTTITVGFTNDAGRGTDDVATIMRRAGWKFDGATFSPYNRLRFEKLGQDDTGDDL